MIVRTLRHTALLLGAAALLGACSTISDVLTEPTPSEPVPEGEGYMAQGGPRSETDLGPDSRSLLADFTETQRIKLHLESELRRLESTKETLEARLTQVQEEHASERNQRIAAETELERLRGQLRDREAKILSMAIQNTRLERELLLLRIGALGNQIDELAGPAPTAIDAAAPPPGGR